MSAPLQVETSFAQQSLWLLDQADPGQPTYNVLAAVRMRGQLDVPALHRALNAVVARHEALRTSFGFDGYEPVQVIVPELAVPLPVVDAAPGDVDRLIQEENLRMIDQSTGQGNALSHAAGKVMRIRVRECFQANQAHESLNFIPFIVQQSARNKTYLNVTAHGQPGKKIWILKNKTAFSAWFTDRVWTDQKFAGISRLEPGDQTKEGGFSATTRAD